MESMFPSMKSTEHILEEHNNDLMYANQVIEIQKETIKVLEDTIASQKKIINSYKELVLKLRGGKDVV